MSRPRKFTQEEIFNDPELMEAIGHAMRNEIIDENYGRLRYEGKSHEEAAIGARKAAGMNVPPGTKVGPESYANAQTAQAYRMKRELEDLKQATTNQESPNQKRMAGTLIASLIGAGAAGAGLSDVLNVDNINEEPTVRI